MDKTKFSLFSYLSLSTMDTTFLHKLKTYLTVREYSNYKHNTENSDSKQHYSSSSGSSFYQMGNDGINHPAPNKSSDWSNFLLISSLFPSNSSRTEVVNVNNYYGAPYSSKKSSQDTPRKDEEKKEHVNLLNLLAAALFSGTVVGGSYLMFNNYLDYKEEKELLKEIKKYKDTHRDFVTLCSPILKRNNNYSWNMFTTKSLLMLSGISLLGNYLYLDSLPMMYCIFAVTTCSGIYGMVKYSLYQREVKKTQNSKSGSQNILNMINELLKKEE